MLDVSKIYTVSSYIQSNATLNRALMESFGVEIPFTIMGNNKDEKIERGIRANLFVLASFVAPVISMPAINKIFMKKAEFTSKDKHLLQISKEYLTKDADFLKKGFVDTASEFVEKFKNTAKPKHKEVAEYLKETIKSNRFSDLENLRKTLAKTHKNIFLTDFLVASLCAISIPWFSNYITEKRTKRVGYVGEFKIADKKYTDKMAENHEQGKKTKIAISFVLPVLTGLGLSKKLHSVMLHPDDKLGKLGKYLKKNIKAFDYKDTIYMSKMGYLAVMFAGDAPSYLLACRDKHELKMRATAWVFLLAMLFGGDFALNNAIGRFCDHRLGTRLMNDNEYKNAGFFKRFKMDVNSFDKLNKIEKTMSEGVLSRTKKFALGMYWGNLALTAAIMGFGLSAITNASMKKDVKKDLAKLNKANNFNNIDTDFSMWLNKINSKKISG